MEEIHKGYFMGFVAAYVRGYPGMCELTGRLGVNEIELDDLNPKQLEQLFRAA